METRKYFTYSILILTIIVTPLFATAQSQTSFSPVQTQQLINQLSILIQQLQRQLTTLLVRRSRPIPPTVVVTPIISQPRTLPLSSLIAYLPSKYHPIINNPKINAAVTKVGLFDHLANLTFNTRTESLQSEELNFLRDKILQLENDSIQNWGQYRVYLQNGTFPPPSVYRELWLQKIALSFYTEANKIVPWSLTNYSDTELSMLLSFNDSSYGDSDHFFNNNPLIPRAYGLEVSQLYQSAFSSPKDLTFSIVKKMRNDFWVHFSGGTNYLERCGLSRYPTDFQCLTQVKNGGSEYTPLFISSILAAYNVPSQRIGAPRFQGHGGITFPSLNLAMDGDVVYEDFGSGFSFKYRTPPKTNLIPVENSFMNLDFAKLNVILPANPNFNLQCKAASAGERIILLSYFKLYDHPVAKEDLIFAYNYSVDDGQQPGEWLKTNASRHIRPGFCDSDNPSDLNYWEPPLSDSELNYWIAKIPS